MGGGSGMVGKGLLETISRDGERAACVVWMVGTSSRDGECECRGTAFADVSFSVNVFTLLLNAWLKFIRQ